MTSDQSAPKVLQSIRESFAGLAESAKALNKVSDEFGAAIAGIEAAIGKLGVGVEAWHKFAGGWSEDGEWWSESLGYAKIGSRWCLAIRTACGDYANPDGDSAETWPLNEAPRALRVDAVPHISALILALNDAALKAKAKIEKRTEDVRAIASELRASIPPAAAAPRKK